MPVLFQWDDDAQTIAHFIIEAPMYSWGQYHTAVDNYCRHIETLPHTVHIIFDAPTDVTMPPGNLIAEIKYTFSMLPHNVGITCSIAAPRLIRRVLRVTLRLIRSNHKLVSDLDTAYALIDTYKKDHKHSV